MKEKLVLFGTGNTAKVILRYLQQESAQYEVVAFAVDEAFLAEKSFQGLPVVAFEAVEQAYPPAAHKMFIAAGYADLNQLRADRCAQAREKGYGLISHISSRAVTWAEFKHGENCFVGAGVHIEPFVELGDNVMIWSGSFLGHDCRIGDHSFISASATLSGGVGIGSRCFLGSGVTIGHSAEVGERCIIGAGCTVTGNVAAGTVLAAPAARTMPAGSDSKIIRSLMK